MANRVERSEYREPSGAAAAYVVLAAIFMIGAMFGCVFGTWLAGL